MNNKYKTLAAIGTIMVPIFVAVAPLNDFTFKSPSFNGQGYSSHVLTIENQEATRRKQVQDKIQAEIDKAAADARNTNLAKFINNLESRIYAQISQNVATAMFAAGSNCSSTTSSLSSPCGSLDFDSNAIIWWKESDGIHLRIAPPGEDPTTIVIPLGQFQF